MLPAFLLSSYYRLLALAFWGKRQPFSRGTIGLHWASHYLAGVCSLYHVHCARLTLVKFCCGALSCFAPLEAFAAMRTTSLTTTPPLVPMVARRLLLLRGGCRLLTHLHIISRLQARLWVAGFPLTGLSLLFPGFFLSLRKIGRAHV